MGFYTDVLKPSLVGFPPNLQRAFIMNWCWILSNTFSLSADVIIRLFFCSLFIWWIVWLDLNVDPALHFCSKPCSLWNTHTHTPFASILSRNFMHKIEHIGLFFFLALLSEKMNFECFFLFPSQPGWDFESWLFFFSKYLVEFSGETILAWRFHLMEFINFTSWEYVGMSLALIHCKAKFQVEYLTMI